MRTTTPHTAFAPAERLPIDQVREQRLTLLAAEPLAQVLDAIPQAVLFFNNHRQLVHANDALLKLVNRRAVEDLLGLRLGEILGCEHTVCNLGGCGTDTECRNCTAIRAMLSGIDGQPADAAFSLELERQGHRETWNCTATVRPVPVKGVPFTMLLLTRLGCCC